MADTGPLSGTGPKPVRIAVGREKLIRMSPPSSRHGRQARPYIAAKEFFPMGIFSRTRDIIAANVTDLLDKAEDPAKMIRMIILEMEETLVEVRASAARTIADQKEMRRQIGKLDRLQDSWVEKAELALSKGREDLAKAALFEKQKAADMGNELKTEIEVLDDALRASEQDISKLQNKLREARTRQNALMTRMESAHNRARLRELYSGPKVDEAFSRFDVLERHADLAEGHADALSLGGPPKTLDEEISELRNSEKVDAELEAMKAQLAKRSNGGEADSKGA
jgi:phage shock protein A